MKKMLEIRVLLATTLLFCGAIVANSQECPIIAVTPSPEKFVFEKPASFTASIGGIPEGTSYRMNWLVSGGTIVDGQGTEKITVDTSGVDHSIMAKVTFTVRAPGRCNLSAEAYAMPIPPARKLDEYRVVSPAAESRRLRTFVDALNKNPWATAYIISYGGRTSDESAAEKGFERVEAELLKQGILAQMIATFDGGYKEAPTIELWIVPNGAPLPEASPTIEPSEVRPQSASSKKPSTKKGT